MRLAKLSSVRSSILLLQTKPLVPLQRDTEYKWDCNWLRKVRNPNSSLSRSGLNTTGRFSCGSRELDSYLQKQAGQDLKKRAAVPFVITPDHRTIAGFYTLSQYALDLGSVPEEVAKRLPRYPMVSATLLGRLAVSNDFRDQGLGERLL